MKEGFRSFLERLIEASCEKSEFNKDIIRRIRREDWRKPEGKWEDK